MRIIKCDECGTKIDVLKVALIIDGDLEYHFCNYRCMLKFIANDLKTEDKNV